MKLQGGARNKNAFSDSNLIAEWWKFEGKKNHETLEKKQSQWIAVLVMLSAAGT